MMAPKQHRSKNIRYVEKNIQKEKIFIATEKGSIKNVREVQITLHQKNISATTYDGTLETLITKWHQSK